MPALPRGRRCHTRHNDPGLQPAGLLRHTEDQEINVIPIKTAVAVHRTRIARKSGARLTSLVLSQNQCAVRCHRKGPGVTTLHTPVKKISEAPSTTRRTRFEKLQVKESTSSWTKLRFTEHPTRIARTTGTRWTSFCMQLGLVPPRNKHTKIMIMEAPEK